MSHVVAKSKVALLTWNRQQCTITAKSIIQPGEEIPDNTVVYANGTRRIDKRDIAELKFKAQTRQIEVLRRLIPSNPAKFKE